MMPLSEFETRKQYIDKKLAFAGWEVLTKKGVIESKKACIEIPTKHMPITNNCDGLGYCDYVLFGDDGKPLAIVEAKKTIVNEEVGRVQACLYADSLEKEYGIRPVIYYTNGQVYKVIDGIFPARKVFGIHSKSDLEHIIEKRNNKITDKSINPVITNRYYQEEAINKVLECFEKKKSRSLIVLATGTGKTRVSCSLSDIFIRNNFVKRILFLADRKNLVKQAKEDTFDKFLPNTSTSLIMEGQKEADGVNARIVFSTYQSMLSIIKDLTKCPYSIGHFDLIIVDEAHRSLFNKYAEIFDYFDTMMIGLTATPRKEIHKSTYKVFNIDDDTPHYEYDLVKGVRDGYLVHYRALDRTPNILRNGLYYDDLSEEEKERYEDLFTDEEGNLPSHIEGKEFYDNITNIDTIKKVIENLLDEGIYTNNGDVLGKTIIFAKDKRHADLIVSTFRQMHPELCLPNVNQGIDFCVAIYDSVKYNDVLQREFKVGQRIRIVVSVDMMDTGVDVTDCVNLVFFKKVLSSIKFWQMVGRGTRIHPGINALSPSKNYFDRETNDATRAFYENKLGFLIFDICDVFNFFNIHPEGKKSSAKTELSLNQKIYLTKCALFSKLQENYYKLDPNNRNLYFQFKDELHQAVVDLNDNYIGVQSNILYVDKYRNADVWDNFKLVELKEIESHIAPLIVGKIDLEVAKRFDHICYQFMLSRYDKRLDSVEVGKVLYKIIAKGLLQHKLHISAVAEKEELLRKYSSNEFLNSSTPHEIDECRIVVRELVKFIDRGLFEVLISDFTDFIIIGGDADDGNHFDFRTYEDKVYTFLKESISEGPYAKIHNFMPLTAQERNNIISDLKAIDEKEYVRVFKNDDLVIPYVRTVLDISQLKINEFISTFKNKGYSEVQIMYIRKLILFIKQNGDLKRKDLLKKELSFKGILNSIELDEVITAIETILA